MRKSEDVAPAQTLLNLALRDDTWDSGSVSCFRMDQTGIDPWSQILHIAIYYKQGYLDHGRRDLGNHERLTFVEGSIVVKVVIQDEVKTQKRQGRHLSWSASRHLDRMLVLGK